MGAMADRINGIHVHASAPGGGVHGELRGYAEVEIYFSSGFYGQTSERELERRLEGLARLLWTTRARAYRDVMTEFTAFPDDPEPESDEDVRFYEERDQLLAVGRSDDDRIVVSVRGMQQWRVRLADDTLRALDERSFISCLRTAATRMINDQAQQMIQLKGRVAE
jgi:hypothetical protein